MLFLADWLFSFLWTIFYFVYVPLGKWQLNSLLDVLAIYVLSLGASYGILYLIYLYQKEWLAMIRSVLKIQGIRWLAFMGFFGSLCLILMQFFSKGMSGFVFYLALPYGTVSLLNLLGIEYYPRFLLDHMTPPIDIDLPKIPDDIKPMPVDTKFRKHFRWDYDGKFFSLQLDIREDVYNELKSRPRVELEQWAQEYVTGGIQPEIRDLAFQLYKLGEKYCEYGSQEEIAFILGFVQSAIQYAEDIVDGEPGEYRKYPIETLVEEKGDCEDVSFLGAAILKSMGYDVALLHYPRHIALGVAGSQAIGKGVVEYNDKKYLYVEMTASGWQVGEIPNDRAGVNLGVYPVPDLEVANKQTWS